MNHLYIDIETIPGDTMPTLDEVKVPGNYSKPEAIAKFKAENQVEQWKSESLISHKGRILCVGIALNDEEPRIISGTDQGISEALNAELVKTWELENNFRIVGHNICGFDLKWISHRAFKYNLAMKTFLPTNKSQVCDTMIMWGGLDYKDMTSLDNIAKFLGLQSSKSNMSGKDIFDKWQNGQIQEIYNYCKEDVKLTRDVFKRMI